MAGKSVAARTLESLHEAGCEAVAVNLHHLGEAIVAAFGTSYHGLPLTYSPEPEILGTLGALGPLRSFIAEADLFLIVNGDSLCRWPFEEMIARHQEHGGPATLLVHEQVDPRPFGGGLALGADGEVLAFRGGKAAAHERRLFAGAHLLSPAVLADRPLAPGDIVSGLYEPLLAAGTPIHTYRTNRPWHDLGTPWRYLEGVRATLAERRQNEFLSAGAAIAEEAEISGSAIEAEAEVAAGAIVEGSLVMPGAKVGAGARVRRSILGPGIRVPATAEVEGELLSCRSPEHPLPAGARLDGELVRQPLQPPD